MIVFPAAVNADPGLTLTELMSLGEYANVHCKLEGASEPAVKERLSDTELPLAADPEDRLREGA